MAYKSIFDIKVNGDNRQAFCERLVNLLSGDLFIVRGGCGYDGYSMLNILFKKCPFNPGYESIEDLLKERNTSYQTIESLVEFGGYTSNDDELLANIEIIINVLEYGQNHDDFYQKEEYVCLVYRAIENYLLSIGYKMIKSNGRLAIVENDIKINIDEIKDNNLKEDILNYYDYKNENNVDEKRKILTNMLIKLDGKRANISRIFGSHLEQQLFCYANNFQLRHINIDPKVKKDYKETIADLSNNEYIEWYDFIYSLAINIYQKLDILKDVNISGNFKR